MPRNPPEGMPRVIPYLFYNDVAGAVQWLEDKFGFKKRFEMPGPDGSIMHADMTMDDGVIMMGRASEEAESKSPSELAAVHQSLYVYVADVDAHFEHANKAGAQIVLEPEDMFWGDRMYAVKDLEGHHWSFAQHIKDVAPEDMKPPGM